MVSIVLASHGDLAAGIKQTGSMVFGDQPSVAVVSLEPSMGPDDFRAKVEEAIASFEDQEQVLFLVDLWGGTPFNQISGLIEGHDSWAIVTGVNLPMLIEAYSQRFDAKNTAHAIAKHLVTEAKAGVRVKPESLEPEEKKLFLADMGLEESGLDRLIQACYSLLGLISYRERSSATGTSRLPTSVSTPVCCMVRWLPRGPSRSTPTASSWFPTALLTTSSARP